MSRSPPQAQMPATPSDRPPRSRHRPWFAGAVLTVIAAGIGLWIAAPTGPRPLLDATDPPSAALVQRTPGQGFARLSAAETGLDFRNELVQANNLPYINNGAGIAIGDFDADGRPDVFAVSQDGANKLFRQTGPWQFEDVTESAGVTGLDAWGTGAVFVDFDNDGDLDLYVCNLEAPNELFVNGGDGTFTEAAGRHGLAIVGASTCAAFADVDRDGDLDVYLVRNRVFNSELHRDLLAAVRPPADTAKTVAQMTARKPTREEVATGVVPEAYREHIFEYGGHYFLAGQSDLLLRNDGGEFRDATAAAGFADQGMGLSAIWWDYDDDGWPDLYVANDLESPDRLWHNDGDGTFTDVTLEALPHTAYYGMGSDAADIDNDGRLDLLVADMASRTHFKAKWMMGNMADQAWFLTHARPQQYMRNALFVNTGTGRFLEAGYLTDLAKTDWTWAVKFGDLDNDGRVDVFASNGVPRFDIDPDLRTRALTYMQQGRTEQALDLLRSVPPMPERNVAMRNAGDLEFVDTGATWGLDHEGVSHGAAFGDLDGDGDLDLVVNNFNDELGVFRNDVADGHAIVVQLIGTTSNRQGLDAKVRVRTAQGTQLRQLTSTRGYLSSDEPVLHFGLGGAQRIDSLTVDWPSGVRQEYLDLPADRRYVITERERGGAPPDEPAAEPWFVEVAAERGLTYRHRESDHDDFAVQPLVPHRHSRLGPGIAVADVDGDGRDDVFVGGAAGSSGALFVGGVRSEAGFDAAHEDLGALWIEIDGGGAPELFVASGSSEFAPDDPRLADRLYRVTPDGTVAVRLTQPGATDSAGPAAAADFDGDGDLDLFVGGRVVPGRYPQPAASRLWRNDAGTLVDATAELAPMLGSLGLVTGALWSDTDGDGSLELLLTRHWGPVTILRRAATGRFEDVTAAAGLAEHTGWWNAIAGGDLDGDGDIDYVATNFGRNTKYHADREHPARVYAADFDGNGVLDVVESKFEGDRLLPVRGLSCSSGAIPPLAGRVSSFEQFARATLPQIYSEEALDSAQRFEANHLDSSLLRNRGDGTFAVEALPRRAQIAPAFGVVIADFDADGHADVHLTHNFWSCEPETGRMDGGVSLLLRGDVTGRLHAVAPDRSGLLVPDDGKASATIDIDDDGRPDLLVASNDGPLRLFHNRATSGRPLAVQLRGDAGNPTAIGARVTVETQDGGRQTAEVYAGSGYLSQSSATLFFGLGPGQRASSVRVRWPDGTHTEHRNPAGPLLRLQRK